VPLLARLGCVETSQELSTDIAVTEAVGVGSPIGYVPTGIASAVPRLTLISTPVVLALMAFAATLAHAPGVEATRTTTEFTGSPDKPACSDEDTV
jgi:hypothetical protein